MSSCIPSRHSHVLPFLTHASLSSHYLIISSPTHSHTVTSLPFPSLPHDATSTSRPARCPQSLPANRPHPQADDELDEKPILAGFEWDRDECYTRFIVHQKKEGAPVNLKKSKKEKKLEELAEGAGGT